MSDFEQWCIDTYGKPSGSLCLLDGEDLAKAYQAAEQSMQGAAGYGSAKEFSTSDNPHCKEGGDACIDCLMRGSCLMSDAKQSMQNSLVGEIKGKASSGSPLVIIHDWDLPSGTKLYTHAPDSAAVIADLQAQVEALGKDAERYRWLRGHHWDKNTMCVVVEPESKIKLGTYCPSAELLDAAIDAAISKGGE